MRRSVVTGADGFAGRWLCRLLLEQGDEVHAWVHHPPQDPVEGLRHVVLDIRDAAACRNALGEPPDRLFHLAALTRPAEAEADPALAQAVNVEGTANVLRPLPADVPAVLASTCHVYGDPLYLPIDEAHPLKPRGVYARTKAEAEAIALEVHPRTVLARAFHQTGPGQSSDFALSSWARQIAAGELPLHVGNLDLRRDYSDVRDIVAGYILLSEAGVEGEAVNLCSGEAPPLRDLLRILNGGVEPGHVVEPELLRPGEPSEIRGNPAKARRLGWQHSWELAQTLMDLRASLSIPASG